MPVEQRAQFEYDWQHKLFHRWQFLFHTGFWNGREAAQLLASAMGAVPEALQHFAGQESVRSRVARFVQSPFTCLGSLVAVLLAVAILSGGFPATRDLFFNPLDLGNSKLVYIWSHNLRGGGDRPLPADAVQAWKANSHLISDAAAFRAVHRDIQIDGKSDRRLVVTTEPSFFRAMDAKLLTGSIDTNIHAASYVVLSFQAWMQLFHASPQILGHNITIANHTYLIRGVLPAGFQPLSRQLTIYLVEPTYLEQDAYVVAKANPGVSQQKLNAEITEIAYDIAYYFLNGQLRFGFARSAAWSPMRSFGVALLASALMLLAFFRLKWKALWPTAGKGKAWLLQSAFFSAKTGLALACIFSACLEWSRSRSAILFGNFDPATGPFLLWLYILLTMGVLFWSAFDQKARCRKCLQLLGFPVRMGSPGNLFLDWSGIELCCTDGHGVLHVPHLSPTWADESDHWIALDDSWQGIFGPGKHLN